MRFSLSAVFALFVPRLSRHERPISALTTELAG